MAEYYFQYYNRDSNITKTVKTIEEIFYDTDYLNEVAKENNLILVARFKTKFI